MVIVIEKLEILKENNDKLMNKVNKLANTKYRLANNSGSINLLLFTSFFGFIIVLGITIGLFLI